MVNLLCCKSVTGHWIATNFCTWHDSTAVVPCTKFCSDHWIRTKVIVKQNLNFDVKTGPRSTLPLAANLDIKKIRDLPLVWRQSNLNICFENWKSRSQTKSTKIWPGNHPSIGQGHQSCLKMKKILKSVRKLLLELKSEASGIIGTGYKSGPITSPNPHPQPTGVT